MEYLVEGTKYKLSYSDLKEKYILTVQLSDNEFIEQLPKALHLACIICYLKEIPTYVCLSDKGIIHELTHLLHIPEQTDIKQVRQLFKKQLELK